MWSAIRFPLAGIIAAWAYEYSCWLASSRSSCNNSNMGVSRSKELWLGSCIARASQYLSCFLEALFRSELCVTGCSRTRSWKSECDLALLAIVASAGVFGSASSSNSSSNGSVASPSWLTPYVRFTGQQAPVNGQAASEAGAAHIRLLQQGLFSFVSMTLRGIPLVLEVKVVPRIFVHGRQMSPGFCPGAGGLAPREPLVVGVRYRNSGMSS